MVFATALFFLFLKIHFSLGLTAIVIGHTVWNSAYAAIIVQARMAGLDPALEEAAADLGATPWRAFRRVTLAALLPAIIAAGLLAFTFSFDDVVTSVFLQGRRLAAAGGDPGDDPLPDHARDQRDRPAGDAVHRDADELRRDYLRDRRLAGPCRAARERMLDMYR